MTKTFKTLEWLLALLSGTALMIMMVLTFVDVIGRYGFNNSIFGTAEWIELLMAIVVFAGVAFISAGDQHIKVEILDPVIKKYVPGLQRWITHIFSIIMYAILAWELCRQALAQIHNGKATAVLNMPEWLVTSVAAAFSVVGVALLLLGVIITKGHPAQIGSFRSDVADLVPHPNTKD